MRYCIICGATCCCRFQTRKELGFHSNQQPWWTIPATKCCSCAQRYDYTYCGTCLQRKRQYAGEAALVDKRAKDLLADIVKLERVLAEQEL